MAVNCLNELYNMDIDEGVIAMEVTVGGATVTVNTEPPEIRFPAELRVAVIVGVPTATPVDSPVEDIAAFVASDELQVAVLEISAVVPSE